VVLADGAERPEDGEADVGRVCRAEAAEERRDDVGDVLARTDACWVEDAHCPEQ
jgi:hypothetical protein